MEHGAWINMKSTQIHWRNNRTHENYFSTIFIWKCWTGARCVAHFFALSLNRHTIFLLYMTHINDNANVCNFHIELPPSAYEQLQATFHILRRSFSAICRFFLPFSVLQLFFFVSLVVSFPHNRKKTRILKSICKIIVIITMLNIHVKLRCTTERRAKIDTII